MMSLFTLLIRFKRDFMHFCLTMGKNETALLDLATFNRRHFQKHYFFENLSVHGV